MHQWVVTSSAICWRSHALYTRTTVRETSTSSISSWMEQTTTCLMHWTWKETLRNTNIWSRCVVDVRRAAHVHCTYTSSLSSVMVELLIVLFRGTVPDSALSATRIIGKLWWRHCLLLDSQRRKCRWGTIKAWTELLLCFSCVPRLPGTDSTGISYNVCSSSCHPSCS